MLRCQPDILKSATTGRGQKLQQRQQHQEGSSGFYHCATMAIDNSRPSGSARRGGGSRGSLVRFPSIGYLQASAGPAGADADAAGGSYAPVYGKNYSERLSRKVYATAAAASRLPTEAAAAEEKPRKPEESSSSSKTLLPKMEVQQQQQQQRGFDPHGYAMLTDPA
uniref:Uncharacterized protein n=1 Tax=Macrostomum lignano TaxID=282301 RepID=A0A1I8J8G4_9PLAT